MIHSLKGLALTRTVFLDGKELSPSKSQKVYNHSPDGFNWGYGGSGPAQLALAVLLELANKDTVLKDYQDFKWKIILMIPQNRDFEIKFNYESESESVPHSSFDMVS